MKPITNAQIRCIKAMTGKLKLQSSEAGIIAGCTGNRTEDIKQMYLHEATDMIRWLKEQDPEEQAAEKMRRNIIAMAHEMNWQLPGTTKADMPRIDAWCKKYSPYKKTLNQHRYKELPALVTQFKQVYASFLKGI